VQRPLFPFFNRKDAGQLIKRSRTRIYPNNQSFTLVELIIVVIIVGILASLGLTQYSAVVEKSRLTEARVRLANMRQLAYEYYVNNGTMNGMQTADINVDNTCTSTNFYRYNFWYNTTTWVWLLATRCTSGGKSPDASAGYTYAVKCCPFTGQSEWYCENSDGTGCYGLPPIP